ncbi:MAG: hypothetical protein CMI18_09660 [Opitutaceae bacterium]|nr:hypothetical protein [Opitutaceae bacterium]
MDTLLNRYDGELGHKTAAIILIDDSQLKFNERIGLVLSEPSENTPLGDLSNAEALIYDDDGGSRYMINISTRGYVGFRDDRMIFGFVITGNRAKQGA